MAQDQAQCSGDQEAIRFQLPADRIPPWYVFMRRGFRVLAPAGLTVRQVLCDHFGVDPEYLDKRVQTLFINGQPVDDVDQTMVVSGDELSLSAAMPGLAGASLRKGGHLAAFRDSISYRPQAAEQGASDCWITIKLFNFVAVELGPLFLRHGLMVPRRELIEFLSSNRLSLTASQTRVSQGEQPLTVDEVPGRLTVETEWVDIQVEAA